MCLFVHMCFLCSYQVLKLLNSNSENPYLIWNNGTRAELMEFLEEQQESNIKRVRHTHTLLLTHSSHTDPLTLLISHSAQFLLSICVCVCRASVIRTSDQSSCSVNTGRSWLWERSSSGYITSSLRFPWRWESVSVPESLLLKNTAFILHSVFCDIINIFSHFWSI